MRLFKSGIGHDIFEFWQGPHPPIIGKHVLSCSLFALQFEIDVEDSVMVNLVKTLLLPFVYKTRMSGFFRIWSMAKGSAKGINDEQTARIKMFSASFKIA